jgi:hypothetical protein
VTTPSKTVAQVLDEKGVRRLGLGAGLGFAGAVAAIVLPLGFLFTVTTFPGGFFTFSSMLVEVTSILVLAGAILLLLSLFAYRRGFAALRKVHRHFYIASVLCIIGSVGFLLILIAAAVTLGDSSSLLSCAHGQPSHALSCLESGEPLGAVTGLVGFVLGWIGGVGIVVGLLMAGSRFRAPALSGGGVVYGLLLLILIDPLVSLFVSLPHTSYLLLLAPLLAVVAPGLALAGSLRTTRGLTRT